MKWKEIILGALITLVVTTVAGVVVWNLTKEPKKPEPESKVVFERDSKAHFKSKSQNLVFNTVRIGNLGNKTAHKLKLSIDYPEKTNILDFTISNSTGKASAGNHKELESESSNKLILIENLMPDEIVTISILTDGLIDDSIEVSARYAEGIGQEGSLAKGFFIEPERNRYEPLYAAFVAMLLGVFMSFMIYRLKQKLGGSRSINNSAFMMLHQGLIENATKMLESGFNSKGGTAYELANLGLCKALNGELETAEKFYKSAELYSKSKEIKALVEFNRSISYFNQNNFEKAKQHFTNAVNTSKSTIKWYVSLSDYAQELVDKFDEFKEFSSTK
jgi:tetratricopeptide (TPR) repeat protein